MINQVGNMLLTNSLHFNQQAEKCNCSTIDSHTLLIKLYEILESLQEEMAKKDQEIERVKYEYEEKEKVKDEIIKRLVQANEKLSQENENLIEKSKKREKERIFTQTSLALQEFDRSKGNISELLTLDNSFRNKTEFSNSSSLVKPVQRTLRKSFKHVRSCISLKTEEQIPELNKGAQYEERLRSPTFKNKRIYNWFDNLQTEKSQRNPGIYKIQVSIPPTYKRLGSPITPFRQIY